MEFIFGAAVGIVTRPAVKKAKAKIKPWLSKKLKSLLEDKDD